MEVFNFHSEKNNYFFLYPSNRKNKDCFFVKKCRVFDNVIYSMLYDVMLYNMLSYVALLYDTLCYVNMTFIMLYVMLCCDMLCYAMCLPCKLCNVMMQYAMICHDALPYDVHMR